MSIVSADSVPVEVVKSVVEPLPLSARTNQNVNSPSFHIIKLPSPGANSDRLRRVVAEYCIQPLGSATRQAIWWTSYIVIARTGTLTRKTGVYTDWTEFGTLSSQPATGIIAPRDSGIIIVDTNKGVLNGNQTNGTVLQVVDMSEVSSNVDVYALLVASGMHDGAYQVSAQARLEYRVREG
ncbi:hypothetical protein M378DRAFT_172428 [Amanita muscaria Koide BX008]|uniref:Uncharacterized protein n=1 Tax=Amanita muscaria (strain Koide BX008) TaxID=946122 RepID=A0A0C2S290_AMAMK|nr:hypothetical protein M378DRAFT_172428 [Amanita muscaria Koide BX008]